MNAYELADQVEMWGEDLLALNMKGGIPVIEGAKLIRQQADRIAELEKASNETITLEELRKTPFYHNVRNGIIGKIGDSYIHDMVHRSTPQTKPLSNDEILEMTIWNKNLYELYVEMEKEDMIAFARAIEERHGIK